MRPIMLKFNNDRRENFRISTVIYQDGGHKIVAKKALVDEAKEHIRKLYENQALLQKVYPECIVCPARLQGDTVYFDYMCGELLSDKYEKALISNDKELFLSVLKMQKEMVLSCVDENFCDFVVTEDYKKIFGEGKAFEGQRALKVTNFEFTSHNIILGLQGNKTGLIDYEYVFEFPIPLDLILYHCVIKTNILTLQGFTKLLKIEDIFKELEIKSPREELEAAWERFGLWYGSSNDKIKHQYLKNNDDIAFEREKYLQAQQEIIGNNNYIDILTTNLDKQQKFIAAQQEEIRLQKDLVFVKEEEIAKQRDCITKQKDEILHKLTVIKKLDQQKQQAIMEAQQAMAEKEKQIAELNCELEEKKQVVQCLQDEILAVRQSLSWKIGAPMRKILDIINKK